MVSRGSTLPVGLLGLQIVIIFVRLETALRTSSRSGIQPSSSRSSTSFTVTPMARAQPQICR